MREVSAEAITELVAKLCVEANTQLPQGLKDCIRAARRTEKDPLAQAVLGDVEENFTIAAQRGLPICQDTGMAVVFLTLGQEVHVVGGGVEEAVNAGVAKGYVEGKLRCSVVADPLRRGNTGDNTPALLTLEWTAGESLEITVAPKGAGSENMSRLAMLKPADGEEGVRRFVLETVRTAGANPCPPVIVGVGIGGSFDKAALLAKKALLRPLDTPNPDPCYAALEAQLLAEVNTLGIGPQGFGGRTTALGLSIEAAPTHVASLPVAVNMSCHATRRASARL